MKGPTLKESPPRRYGRLSRAAVLRCAVILCAVVPSSAPPDAPSIAHAAHPAAPAAQSPASIAGPPVASDLALWPREGMAPLTHIGGVLHSPVYEPKRDIVWIAEGPRIVALAVEGDRVHRLGRTPALPTFVGRLDAGDGVVLAIDQAERPGLWLVDGRDPAWPRTMRRIELGAPPTAITIEGREALVAAGEAIVRLDLGDPALPREIERWPVPSAAEGSEVIAIAGSGPRVALLQRNGDVRVRDARGSAGFVGLQRVPSGTGLHHLALEGDHLVVGASGASIRGLALDGSPDAPSAQERWRIPGDAARPVLQLALARDRLVLTSFEGGGDRIWLREWTLPARNAADPDSPKALGAPLILGPIHLGPPGYLSVGVASRPDRPHLLLLEGHVRVVPQATLRDQELPAAPTLWPRADTAISLAGRDDWLAVAGRRGSVDLMDVRLPEVPRVVGRWQATPDSERARYVRQMLWHGTHLWTLVDDGLFAVDVTDPARPRTLQSWPVSYDAMLVPHGRWLWLLGESSWKRFDLQAESPMLSASADAPWQGRMIDATVVADRLWLATELAAGGTSLWSLPVAPDGRLGELTRRDFGTPIVAMTALGGRLVLLAPGTVGGADFLQVLDVTDPRGIAFLGTLDLAVGSRSSVGHDLAVWRGKLLVAHTGLGLLMVDIGLPELPDEVGRLPLPLAPGTALDVMSLYATDDLAWAGSWWGGLVALRESAFVPDPATRLWLPLLGEP